MVILLLLIRLFLNIGDQLKNKGVKVIESLSIDEVFPPFPDSWEFGDLKFDYGAQPTSFMLNENIFTVRISPGSKKGDSIVIEFANDYEKFCVDYINTAITTTVEDSNLYWGYKVGDSKLYFEGLININAKPYFLNVSAINPPTFFGCVFKKGTLSKRNPSKQIKLWTLHISRSSSCLCHISTI